MELSERRGAARVERHLVRAAAMFRALAAVHVLYSLVELAVTDRLSTPALVLCLVALAETAALLWVLVNRPALRRAAAYADVTVCSALMVAGAVVQGRTVPADIVTDPWHFLYPFWLASCIVVAARVRSVRDVVAGLAIGLAGYLPSLVLWRPRGVDNLDLDLFAFLGIGAAMWLLARDLRGSGDAIDAATAEAVASEAALVAERERGRYLSELHDHVLQTFEMLARGRFVPDERMRAHVARQAFRLRRLVENDASDADGPCRFTEALADVVEEHIGTGLRVDLQTERLRRLLPAETASVLVGAVHEALTNVRKHSGVSRAVVQAVSSSDAVTVTVLDHGCGFDPGSVSEGVGLRDSIRGRVERIGGSVRIERLGPEGPSGTCVVLVVPLPEEEAA